jgi:hypothetical protein
MTVTNPPTAIKAIGKKYHEAGMDSPGPGVKNSSDLCKLPIETVKVPHTKNMKRVDIAVSLLGMRRILALDGLSK